MTSKRFMGNAYRLLKHLTIEGRGEKSALEDAIAEELALVYELGRNEREPPGAIGFTSDGDVALSPDTSTIEQLSEALEALQVLALHSYSDKVITAQDACPDEVARLRVAIAELAHWRLRG